MIRTYFRPMLALLALLAVPLLVGAAVPAARGAHAAGPVRYVLPGPGPGGEECSVDTNQFYTLSNTIHPGEIGIKTVLGCNQAAHIYGGQQLSELLSQPFVHWINVPGTISTKDKANVLALTMTSWYSCGGLGITAGSIYRSDPSWDVHFSDGYTVEIGDQYGPAFSTKCETPVLSSSS